MICQNTTRPSKETGNRITIPSRLEGNYYFDLERIQKSITTNQKITEALRWFNRLLLGISLLILVSLVFQPHNISQAYSTPAAEVPQLDRLDTFVAPHTFQSKPLAYYLAPVKERSLFESPAQSRRNMEEIGEQFISEVKNNIRLIGIMIDQRPQAILEIISTGETVFIEEGQQVKGAQIKSIGEDKVIFLYKGKELELKR